jgi:hypothetical protein
VAEEERLLYISELIYNGLQIDTALLPKQGDETRKEYRTYGFQNDRCAPRKAYQLKRYQTNPDTDIHTKCYEKSINVFMFRQQPNLTISAHLVYFIREIQTAEQLTFSLSSPNTSERHAERDMPCCMRSCTWENQPQYHTNNFAE